LHPSAEGAERKPERLSSLGYREAQCPSTIGSSETGLLRDRIAYPHALAASAVHDLSSFASVVIYQIHIHGLALLEAEHHAPVARNAHAPPACPVSLQLMQPETPWAGSLNSHLAGVRANPEV